MSAHARTARITLSLAMLLALAGPGTGATGSPGASTPGNPCAPDVEGQFRALKHHGEALGFHLGAGTPDPTVNKHYQGIQRLQRAGTPYLFLTRSGNVTVPTGDDEDEAHLLVVRLGSRGPAGERLRSNRLLRGATTESTVPPSQDRVITDIAFDGIEAPSYLHAGGMDLYGEVLVVPLEQPGSTADNRIVLYDVSDPTDPVRFHTFSVAHEAGAAALTRLQNGEHEGRYLLAVGGPNESRNLHTYLSNGTDIRDGNLVFEPYDVWRSMELASGPWRPGAEAHQTLNFIEQCDGTLYLVGTNKDHPASPDPEDYADLYRVGPIDDSNLTLEHVRTHHVYCESEGGTLCSMAAAGGMYVSPSGELILYGAEHDNDGPGDTVRMGEYRHQDLFRPDSPLWAPEADADGPYSLLEGSSVVLDGTGTRPPFAQAWAELYDDVGFADRSVTLDYADRGLEDWQDLDEIDDFGDRTSSVIWTAPLGCNIVLYQQQDFSGPAYPLPGDGTIRSVADLGGFADTAHSVRFEGSTCDASDIALSWDVDDDGHFEAAGGTASFDAAGADGPQLRHPNLQACGVFYGCDTDATSVAIVNAVPEAEIESLRDELGTEVHEVLQHLEITLGGDFTDAGWPDIHVASIAWGDGHHTEHAALKGFTDSTGGVTGSTAASHSFSDSGTYPLTLRVLDDDGGLGLATTALRVVSAAELLSDVATDLEEAAGDPLLHPLARRHLERALDRLGRGTGRDGAIDRLEAGTPEAALVMLREALGELLEAESLQPGLDLSAEKNLIALAAKSVVLGEISSSTAAPSRIAEADQLVASGNGRLAAGDHQGAVEEFRRALAKLGP